MMAEPIRVAQVMGYMNGGGVESVVMNYYRHIDREKVQFDFIVCRGSVGIPKEEIESLGGRIFVVPNYSRIIEFHRAIFQLCRENSWAIVHSHLNALSVFPLHAAMKAGVDCRIAHSHSTGNPIEGLRYLVKITLRRLSRRYSTHCFACSRHAGDWLFGKNSKYEVIYNAIDCDQFRYSPDIRKEIRQELGIHEHVQVIGHIGRFCQQKNQAYLLDLLQAILAERKDVLLMMIGDGDDKPAVAAEVKYRNLDEHIIILPNTKEIWRYYQAFDIFVLPSLYEGLGMVAIEAQLAGLPCILSDNVPRSASLGGRTVYLPLDDGQRWRDQLSHFMDEGASRTAVGVESSGMRNYDINRQAVALAKRYQSYVGR